MQPLKQRSKIKLPCPGKPTQNDMQAVVMASTESEEKPASEKRVRLSCDIERKNHRKLRMTAAASDKTILQVVESLIEEHCSCQ